jgi:CheY-like chemotaxis protein
MASANAPRVLVIEDDATIRQVLADAMQEDGYEVREAACGQRALEALTNWSPDVTLLDVMMPEMDAAAFRARQRELRLAADAPLIIVSASRTAAKDAEPLGAAGVVMKPFDLPALLDLVEQLLERQ